MKHEEGRGNADREGLPKKKESQSDFGGVCVCVGGVFGGGPLEIIFILKVEVSELSDHNKHGQPGFSALVKMTRGSVDSRRRPCFPLPFPFASHPPHPLQQLLTWAITGNLYSLIQSAGRIRPELNHRWTETAPY